MNSEDEKKWQAKLTPEQYGVLREGATEAPGTSPLNHNKQTGIYYCAACNNPLFQSDTKFDSGSGWPSFTDPINDNAVEFLDDTSHGMRRIEARCSVCHSHLGHVFPDGPGESQQRYCINGLALNFDQKEDEK